MNRLAFFFILMLATSVSAQAKAEVTIEFGPLALPEHGTIAVGAYADGTLLPMAAELNRMTNGAVARAVAVNGGLAKKGSVYLLAPAGTGFDAAIIINMGKPGTGTPDNLPRRLHDLGGKLAQAAQASGTDALYVAIGAVSAIEGAEQLAANIGYGARLGSYRFNRYLRKNGQNGGNGQPMLTRVTVGAANPAEAAAYYGARLAPVAKSVYLARDLISEPASEIYPQSFVKRVKTAAKGLDVDIEVLDVGDMKKLNMGALLGVGRGSERPPRLMIVRYNGAGDDSAPVAFVGKGITFDSGGISIKKNDGMWRMKGDMAGAAAAISTVLALAGRNAKVNAVGVAALAENMPSGSAQRPGDIVTTMSGTTIEIFNTDAEGRLVLADGVWYTQARFKPRILIDIATLTGSVRTAVGDEYAGLFSRHDNLAAQLLAAGKQSGEDLWRLPLHPNQRKDIASPIADIRNVSSTGMAGASVGAQVIGTFVATETVWAHLDIAGVSIMTEERPTTPVGPTGFSIRLLDQLVADYYEE